jgi:adenylate kinase family enzyme
MTALTPASGDGTHHARSSERILVVGLSGSGKSTLAAAVARILELPHVELDSLHWEPNWVEADAEVFRARVAEATSGDGWVVCGNYWNKLGPYLWPLASAVVWLDLPFWVVEFRSVRRTMWRALHRTELWSGNRERIRHLWAKDALWRYNLQNRGRLRVRYAEAMGDPQWSNLVIYRLRSRRQVRRWLSSLRTEAGPRSEDGARAGRPGAPLRPSRRG